MRRLRNACCRIANDVPKASGFSFREQTLVREVKVDVFVKLPVPNRAEPVLGSCLSRAPAFFSVLSAM